jgi:hypothetical protein
MCKVGIIRDVLDVCGWTLSGVYIRQSQTARVGSYVGAKDGDQKRIA